MQGKGFGGAHGFEFSGAADGWPNWPMALMKLALAATGSVATLLQKTVSWLLPLFVVT